MPGSRGEIPEDFSTEPGRSEANTNAGALSARVAPEDGTVASSVASAGQRTRTENVDLSMRREQASEPVRKAIQVHDSYLIAETGDGMVVIDQHALHERILYEELRNRVVRGNIESQRLLVPEPVDLPAAEAALVIEQSELLAQLGLEIESFGGDTVLAAKRSGDARAGKSRKTWCATWPNTCEHNLCRRAATGCLPS